MQLNSVRKDHLFNILPEMYSVISNVHENLTYELMHLNVGVHAYYDTPL